MSDKKDFVDYIKPSRIAASVILIVSVGTVFYHFIEKLKWLDSVYFSVITLTTVGYGDIVPKTDAGKVFTIFYVLLGVGIIASGLSALVRYSAVKRAHHHEE